MRRTGFTLIELLIVMAIIGILAGLVMIAITGANKKAQIGVAKATIDHLRTALEMYKDDVGFYPPGDKANDEGNINMVLALTDDSEVDGGKGGPNSPYYEFRAGDLKKSTFSPTYDVLLDPWGTPWSYTRAVDDGGNIKPGIHNKHSYDLYSWGPNTIDDDGENDRSQDKDDIANWH